MVDKLTLSIAHLKSKRNSCAIFKRLSNAGLNDFLSYMLRVFISYAWEAPPSKIKDAIWDLAGWIEKARPDKVKVITDHLYSFRPPVKGWPIWMQEEIELANIVLIVCSPIYHDRFMKKDGIKGGAGVAFEGAIITQDLLDGKMRNDKFYPILPDGGVVEHIPKILKAYHNGHQFPSGQEGIVKLIFNENPGHTIRADDNSGIDKNINLEREIVEKIAEVEDSKQIYSIVVRSFLGLTEVDKIKISKSLGIFRDDLLKLQPSERAFEIFKVVKKNNLLSQLWTEINKIQAFENAVNPFEKTK